MASLGTIRGIVRLLADKYPESQPNYRRFLKTLSNDPIKCPGKKVLKVPEAFQILTLLKYLSWSRLHLATGYPMHISELEPKLPL